MRRVRRSREAGGVCVDQENGRPNHRYACEFEVHVHSIPITASKKFLSALSPATSCISNRYDSHLTFQAQRPGHSHRLATTSLLTVW